jgi:glycogen debranching enzyme
MPGWTFAGEAAVVGSGRVTLVEGSSFCLTSASGDIEAGTPQGLFVHDTRLISCWQLRLDDEPAEPLTVLATAPYRATFLGRGRPRGWSGAHSMLLRRDRFVGTGMREDLTLVNLSAEATQCELTLTVHCDFADLFEVKEGRVRSRGEHDQHSGSGVLEYSYRWRDRARGCRIQAEVADGSGDDGSLQMLPGLLVFRAVVPARSTWSASVLVTASVDGRNLPLQFPLDVPVERSAPAERLAEWQQRSPAIVTADPTLARTVERSRADLGSLRIVNNGTVINGTVDSGTGAEHRRTTIAAGAPWFMTLFGRDSLLTSFMTLPLDPSLALGTLHTLAALQGRRVDPRSEEEPGRILHEIRSGVDASMALGGGHIYYGTADATPLFVMLLGELRRWGLAPAEVAALLPNADRAIEWIENYGDRDGDCFVEYQRATDRGLLNQGWKDSWDGVTFADGRVAEPPIALAEVQGYAYAAYVARAHLALEDGDTEAARRLTERAADLRNAFNERFWLPDRGWYALALDREKRPVDSLASNMGHCLWTGIVDEDKAASVADHLLSPRMFSGWGVRTLATSMGAYNPMSYHNGSVWPHDNALVAAGLMRYGFVEHAQRVTLGILDAAEAFGGRLPELFCGFDRTEYPAPVPYPTSCSPQAWAAAAPVQLLQVLLRLDPELPNDRLLLAPALPPGFAAFSLRGMPLADARVDVHADGGSEVRVDGLPAGIDLVRAPRAPISPVVPHSRAGSPERRV